MIRILCRNTNIIARVSNNKEIKNPVSITDARFCAKTFVTNMKNEAMAPAPGYKNTPKSYHFFFGKKKSATITQGDTLDESPLKRRKSEKTPTTTPTKPTGGSDRSGSATVNRDEEEKKGILVFTGKKGEKLPKFTPFINGKRVCNGNLFVGVYCPRGKKCPCHHIDFVEELLDTSPGQKDFIKFVNNKETKAKWQQGKKPKRSE